VKRPFHNALLTTSQQKYCYEVPRHGRRGAPLLSGIEFGISYFFFFVGFFTVVA
jgi:hypothetical protein